MDYKKLSIGLALVVAFLGGCLARDLGAKGTTSAHAGAPEPRAGTNPQRWEYYCMRATEDISGSASAYGANGWEMVAAAGAGWGQGLASDHTMVWCFKRAMP